MKAEAPSTVRGIRTTGALRRRAISRAAPAGFGDVAAALVAARKGRAPWQGAG